MSINNIVKEISTRRGFLKRAAVTATANMHEAGVKAFPAKTAGKGNQPLAPRIEKGVRIFELTAEKIQWETTPGQKVEAWACNGQVPGPQIRVREGDRVRFILHNKLKQSTAHMRSPSTGCSGW